MAGARVVITEGSSVTPAVDGIFAGLSFFLVQRLPSRTTFVERVQANGGRVVKLEAQADHVIADHVRLDCPAGSLSYKFIESALRDGELPDPADFQAGPPPGSVRPAGSGVPGKNTRTPFTAEDDKILYQWVERARREGAHVKGNEIYKQLENVNKRHTYQAWRDRYVKRLMDNPPAGVELAFTANAPPSPPRAPDAEVEITPQDRQEENVPGQVDGTAEQEEAVSAVEEADDDLSLPENDVEALLMFAEDIEMIAEDQVEDAWDKFAEDFGRHTAGEWHRIWLEQARPLHLAKQAQEGGSQSEDLPPEDVETLEGTQEHRSLSAGSPKRKRSSGSPEKVYGRKKPKHDGHEILGEQAEEVVTTELSTAAQFIPTEAGVTVPNTSDLNAAAQAQFDEEVFGRPQPFAILNAAATSDMPTSDLNRAAEQQLHQESLEHRDAHTLGAVQALTEANLASQQAEHMDASRRGQDIPADDDKISGEQVSTYLAYLQDVTRQSGQLQNANAGRLDLPTAAPEIHLPSKTPNAGIGAPPDAFTTDAHFSSEAVMDDVLNGDEFVNWPQSPTQPRREEGAVKSPQVSQFETQVAYPSLPQHIQQSSSTRRAVERPVYPNLSQNMAGRGLKSSQTHRNRPQMAEDEDEFEYSIPRPAGAPLSSGVEQNDAKTISSDSSSSSSDDGQPAAPPQRQRRALETQDIVSAETQIPDFEMPLPPDSDNISDQLHSDPREPRSSPPPRATRYIASQQDLANTQTLPDDDINEYIETMIIRGYKEESIINALKATSTRPDLAELVLLEEKAGKGLPNDVAGIWSEEEDKMVEGGNAKALQRLEAKHGWDECEARLEYLSAYRDDEEDNEDEW